MCEYPTQKPGYEVWSVLSGWNPKADNDCKKQKLNYHMVIHNGVPVKTVIWQIYDGTILV